MTVSYVDKDQVFDDVYLDLGKSENVSISLVPDTEQLDAVVVEGSSSGEIFSKNRTGAETNVVLVNLEIFLQSLDQLLTIQDLILPKARFFCW